MTEQEINAAIAEIVGVERDYANDLNAMITISTSR